MIELPRPPSGAASFRGMRARRTALPSRRARADRARHRPVGRAAGRANRTSDAPVVHVYPHPTRSPSPRPSPTRATAHPERTGARRVVPARLPHVASVAERAHSADLELPVVVPSHGVPALPRERSMRSTGPSAGTRRPGGGLATAPRACRGAGLAQHHAGDTRGRGAAVRRGRMAWDFPG